MVFPFGKSFLFFCFLVCLCKILFILDSSDRKNLQIHRIVAKSVNAPCPTVKLCLWIIVKSVDLDQRMSGKPIRCTIYAARDTAGNDLWLITDCFGEHGKSTCEIVAVPGSLFVHFQGIVVFPSVIHRENPLQVR